MTGIYKIQSKIKPNRIYIGSAVNIKSRWTNHRNELKRNVHKSPKLQSHFNKYGENDLCFSVLISCLKEDLLSQEQFFIDSMNPWFNTCKIAGNCLGKICSEETRKKIGKAQLGRKHTLEHRTKNSISNKGRKLTEQHKKRISEALKGKVKSEEAKQKLSKSRKGKTTWNKGLLMSEEIKMKMRLRFIKNPGFGFQKGNRCAIGNKTWLGKHRSEETKQKIRDTILKKKIKQHCF